MLIVVFLGCAEVASAQPQPLPPPPVPPQNPITESKRVLGKMLFWEEQLSTDNTVACGTCHQPFDAGADPRRGRHPGIDAMFNTPDDILGSLGVVHMDASGQPVSDPLFGWSRQVTSRAAQSLPNALWSPLAFWDGRAGPSFVDPLTGQVVIPQGGALESQSLVPILNDVEMAREGRTWQDVTSKLQAAAPMALATHLPADVASALVGDPGYPDLFAAAFGDPAITPRRIAFAIATYERTLVPNQTPFDTQTLTPQQQQGLNVFLNPGSRCAACHQPPFFTDQSFRNIGLRPVAEDPGRQAITGNPADAGRFKVPGLRNVGMRRTLTHNGGKRSLGEMLDFYLGINGQVQFPQNQDPLIPQINIPPQARPALLDFLRNGLTDPRVAAETFPFDRPMLASERGDLNRDGFVDLVDFAAFQVAYGATPGDPQFRPRGDIDDDNDIDLDDATELLANFGGPDK